MSATIEVPLDSLDRFGERLPAPETVDVTIEIVGEDIGDQIEAQRLPWHGLFHDRTNQIIELSVGGRDHSIPVVLRHEISHPTRIWVEEVDGSVRAISIEQEEGPKTMVRFHERQALNAGS